MIDVLGPVRAAEHGGCMECDASDSDGRGDDIFVFQIGIFTIRLCRSHVAMLRTSLPEKT